MKFILLLVLIIILKNCFVFDLTDINSYENIDFKSFDRIFMLASTMEGIDSKIFDENTFEINCNSYKIS